MAYFHEILDEAAAGPEVWRLTGPDASAKAKKLVANGLAPLPPRHMLVGLYQLWVNPDDGESEAAAKTLEGLPPNILSGALKDPTLPPGVLDLLGRKFPHDETVLLGVVGHRNVDDESLVAVARNCPEGICEILADNQTRWLKVPQIVESLYQNPHCRMSSAQRMVELAVREGLDLSLPNLDEIKAAIGMKQDAPEEDGVDEAAEDEAFRSASTRVRASQVEEALRRAEAGVQDDLDEFLEQSEEQAAAEAEEAEEVLDKISREEELEQEKELTRDNLALISKLKPLAKIRMAMMGNAFERSILIRDTNKSVCMSAIKSPRVKENEVEKYAANRTLSHDVIRYIASRREWTKNYTTKLQLVLNPKTPMAKSMTFLGTLRQHDVRKVARSKNIPSALAIAAKRRMSQRS